jgi:Cof subfamily protein (haloacid dehalogenase superfamily)
MKRTELLRKFKLAALDLDGTLLGPDGRISPENVVAVQRMQSAGLQVVLASGRHHNNMRGYAAALPGVQWLVSCQGGEAADVDRKVILHREFLSPIDAKLSWELGRYLHFTTLLYGVDDIFTDSEWNPDLSFYSNLSGRRPTRIAAQQCLEAPIFKVLWIADPRAIDLAREKASALSNVQVVRTHARVTEVMPIRVSKASALKVVAEHLGLEASETIVFGDGDNDVPMFEWAGASVAMAHGWPAALQTATYTAQEGPASTALSRGVDLAFTKGLLSGLSFSKSCHAGACA